MDNVDSTTYDASAASAAEDGEAGIAHVVALGVLLTVWAVLLLLTYVTVAATYFDLGRMSLWIAMIIATIKASLVALYFMHLRYDHPFYGLILITALLFIALFIGLVLVDTSAYQHLMITESGPGS